MITPYQRRQYRAEIAELTAKLRDDPAWDDLRRVLRRRHLRPGTVLLAAFAVEGDGMEYGVLVTDERKVIEYHRRIAEHRLGPRMVVWRDRTTDPQVLVQCPQVSVALEMEVSR